MKTTLELPDELVKAIKLRAIHEGKKLKDAVADLLRKGLSAPQDGTPAGMKRGKITVSKATLDRRNALTRKFVSGEWGIDLSGFEEARKVDRRKDRHRATA